MPFTRIVRRLRSAAVALVSGLWLCTIGHTAQAHPVAQGSMEVDVMSGKIRLSARVSLEEVLVQNALSSDATTARVEPEEQRRRHGEYLLQHVRILADGHPLHGRVADITPPAASGSQRVAYLLEYELPAWPGQIRIEEDVLNEFTYAPGNRWEATYVVRVTQAGQAPVEGLLLTSRDPLLIETKNATSPATNTGGTLDKWRLFRAYVHHGIFHILTGYDHLLFIGALVLAVVTLWDLVKVITAFTLAHSITLTLSVLDIVRLSERVVEPMIAASILFVALQNVFWPARSRGQARLAVAFFFGLFHGLGFAGGLLSAMEGMSGLAIGLAILAFSLGVELGHQVVVVPVFGVLSLLRSQRQSTGQTADYVSRYGSAAISMAGMVYLIAALR